MRRKIRVLVLGVLTVVLAVISGCSLEPELYTVHFESNGGSPVSPITGLRSGDRITEPAPPSRFGYTFSGWYKEPGLITPWNFETDVITSNHTLYAQWLMGPRPFAVDDFYEVSQNSGPTEFQVLSNDLNSSSLPGGDNLAIVRVTGPDNGVVTITHSGTRIEYVPDADYVGQDTFTYTLVDTVYEGDGESTATVTVSVQ